ncbi:hypothetical protein [Candidatus Leptofilum sp.]|uniref:hypothetical protein n=1 Tax=Candidatus Leptofilum sp. TaxID=3241576 RepID=UPI003B5B90DE
MEIVIVVTVVGLGILFAGYLRRSRPKIACEECDSTQVRQLEQSLKKLQQDEIIGLGMKLDVQIIMETRYRCQDCNHSWTVIAPES